MILACSLMLLRYQKDSCWPLTYRLLHSKLFLHFLKQNLYLCLSGRPSDGCYMENRSSIFSSLWEQTRIVCLIWGKILALPRSSKYRICSEAFPTQIGHPSCIATLYLFSPIDALAVCETTSITLPSFEQATILAFGIWPITSANADFTFRESSSLATSSSSWSFVGCHICVITLACGMQIHTGHIIIRSNLASYSTIPAIKLRLSLSDSLESLIMQVPPLDNLAFFYLEGRSRSDS